MEKTYTDVTIRQRVKFVNKKGTFKKCPQCETCIFLGFAYFGLNKTGKDITCDRDIITWKQRSGTTEKSCSYFKTVEQEENQFD